MTNKIDVGRPSDNGGDLSLYNAEDRLEPTTGFVDSLSQLSTNVTLTSGAPGTLQRAKAGRIFFKIGGINGSGEVLRITEEGFYVAGKRVADGKDVYEAFRRWLRAVRGPGDGAF